MARSLDVVTSSTSSSFRLALDRCRLYAPANRPILLLGPIGSGKTTLARLIHRWSGRVGRLVTISGGELVESLFHDTLFGHVIGAFTGARTPRQGAFERASGGTLFFDDLAYVPLAAQSALLRVLQDRSFVPLGSVRERPVECREIYATTVAPDDLVRRNELLPDLASRIGELVVEVPALSERRDDIPGLAAFFAKTFLDEHDCPAGVRMTPEALQVLQDYPWPANVRELRGVIERAVLHAGMSPPLVVVEKHHLPVRVRARGESPQRHHLTVELVTQVLEETGGNKSEAARRLGVHRNTIARYAARIH